jgi:hypothetical protein
VRQPTSSSHTLLVTLLAVVLAAPAMIGVAGASRDGEPPDTRASAADPCQQVLKSQGNAEGLHRRCEAIGAGGGASRGDFNGDGIADLAIGVPYEDIGGLDAAGAVHVIYGSANGLTPTGILAPADQFITHTTLGLVSPSAGDHLGSALAAGISMATATPTSRSVRPTTTSMALPPATALVFTINGSASGLLPSTADNAPTGGTHVSARMGAALVWADFNADGFGDLAIGSPNAKVRGDGLFCSEIHPRRDRRRTRGCRLRFTDWIKHLRPPEPEARRVRIRVRRGWRGPRLARAGRSIRRRARGAAQSRWWAPTWSSAHPGKISACSTSATAGVVHILHGNLTGLSTGSANQLISQDTPGVGGAAEDGDQFGRVLATGNFSGNREALVVGIPFEDVGDNAQRDGGAIQVFFSGLPVVSTDDSVFISQSNLAT